MKYNDSNKPLVCMQTQSTCYKGTSTMDIKGVLWHSTGANNPTLKRYVQPSDDAADRDEWLKLLGVNGNKNDWNHIYRRAGLNCWIGKLADGTVTTVQTMPWNYKPWGCGKGLKGSCNNTHIQFEICEDSLNDKSYFDKVYEEACELTAYICDMYNLDPRGTVDVNGVKTPVILCHADSYKLGLGSNHGDVIHWFKKYGKTMDDVRNDVAKLMGETASSVVGLPSTGSMEDEKKMWDYFMKKVNNPYGVAGLMGNLFAESSLRSNNMQGSYESKLGYTDATYTEAVDNGTYTNFINDGVGYGLAQFTYYTLKRDLLQFAQNRKVSIGDFQMQLDFLAEKLSTEYVKVWNDLKSAKSVLDASNSVLLNFERPASKDSEETQAKRATFGQKYFDKYANSKSKSQFVVGEQVKLIAGATYYNGASISSWVFDEVLYVRGVDGDKITISTLKTGAITGVVSAKYLEHVEVVTTPPIEESKPVVKQFCVGDEVKLVSGAKYTSGKSIPSWVFNRKLYVRYINEDNITISTLKSGAVTGVVNAKYLESYAAKDAEVSKPVTEENNDVSLKVGDAVKLVSGAKYISGASIPSWVFKRTLYIRQLRNNSAVVSTLKSGAVTGTVALKYLIKQ